MRPQACNSRKPLREGCFAFWLIFYPSREARRCMHFMIILLAARMPVIK